MNKFIIALLALGAIATYGILGCTPTATEEGAEKAKDAAGTAIDAGKGALDKANETAGNAVEKGKELAAEAGKTFQDNIQRALESEAADVAKTLKVELKDKAVVITGAVKDEAAKTKIAEILGKVPPVAGFKLDNQVTVEPAK